MRFSGLLYTLRHACLERSISLLGLEIHEARHAIECTVFRSSTSRLCRITWMCGCAHAGEGAKRMARGKRMREQNYCYA